VRLKKQTHAPDSELRS